ncbi:MAG: YggS family pyridoxal phosphate-dependent enzyme, partial [Chthoniobacterales bacterium]
MDQIAANLGTIREQIAAAAEKSGRNPSDIRLVAVCKTHPAGAVAAAVAAGQRVFGESRVQEAREKIPACPPGLDWHFIGHLQKNKVRQALPLFSFFHSIDSPALAHAIESGRTGGNFLPRFL